MKMKTPDTIELGRRSFPVGAKIAEGDLADVHSCTLKNGTMMELALKIGREVRDNDLLENEIAILQYLYPPGTKDEKFFRYLPKLHASGHLPDRRHVAVFPLMEGYLPVSDILTAYPKGIDFRDMVWMYKRLLAGLGFAHAMGVVHGAVLPPHVLVHPTGHGAKIIDWSYALNFTALLKADPPPDPPAPPAPDPGMGAPLHRSPDPWPLGYGIPRDPVSTPAPPSPPKKTNAPSVWDLLKQNNYDDDPAPTTSPTGTAPVDPPTPSKMRIKALSVDYMPYYAPEILRKETPSPATDLYMAAKVAIALCGGDVETGQLPESVLRTDPEGLDPDRCRTALQAFLQASLFPTQHRRPQDAWEVHEDFDKLLRGLVGAPKYRVFSMPPTS
jgi:serine/threonine protein kinase